MSAYGTDSRVKFTYEVDKDDRRRASDAIVKPSFAAALVVPALFGAVVVGTLLWSVPTLRGALLAAGVVGVTVWFVRLALSPQLRDAAREGGRWRVDVEATGEALETSTADSGARVGWDMLVGWMETDTDFYIYPSPFHYHLIPKRELDPPRRSRCGSCSSSICRRPRGRARGWRSGPRLLSSFASSCSRSARVAEALGRLL